MQLQPRYEHCAVLLMGDGSRVSTVAAQLRAEGFRTWTASTLSEVREILAQSTFWPTLAILDGHIDAPWRADALGRMAGLVRDAQVPFLRVGDSPLPSGTPADIRAELPGDCGVAAIVSAACALHKGTVERVVAPDPDETPSW